MAGLGNFKILFVIASFFAFIEISDCFHGVRWHGHTKPETGVLRGSESRNTQFSEGLPPGRKQARVGSGHRQVPRSGLNKSPSRANTENREVPWWMAEKEKNNPKILPLYRPWWLKKSVFLSDNVSDAQLMTECSRRGIANRTREDMLCSVAAWNKRCTLSDKGYVTPTFEKENISAIPTCYPEAYESPDVLIKIRDHVNKYKSR